MIHSDIFGQLAAQRQAELVAEATHQRLVREVKQARRASEEPWWSTVRRGLRRSAIVQAVVAGR